MWFPHFGTSRWLPGASSPPPEEEGGLQNTSTHPGSSGKGSNAAQDRARRESAQTGPVSDPQTVLRPSPTWGQQVEASGKVAKRSGCPVLPGQPPVQTS